MLEHEEDCRDILVAAGVAPQYRWPAFQALHGWAKRWYGFMGLSGLDDCGCDCRCCRLLHDPAYRS